MQVRKGDEVVDLPDEEAMAQLNSGEAQPVERRDADSVETATLDEQPSERQEAHGVGGVSTARDDMQGVDVKPHNAYVGDVDVEKAPEDEGNGTRVVDDDLASGELSYTAPVAGDSPPPPDVPPVVGYDEEVAVTVAPLDQGNGTVRVEDLDEHDADVDDDVVDDD